MSQEDDRALSRSRNEQVLEIPAILVIESEAM